jgi:hypothetical protein
MELTMWYSPPSVQKKFPSNKITNATSDSRMCSLQQVSDIEYICHVQRLFHAHDNPTNTASPKLHSTNTTTILHMLQIQLLILLTLRMEVNPTNTPINLIETDVIKPLETRARNSLHAMIRHEEVFFPAHEDVFALLVILQREGGRFGGFSQRAPGREACPML